MQRAVRLSLVPATLSPTFRQRRDRQLRGAKRNYVGTCHTVSIADTGAVLIGDMLARPERHA